MQDVAGRAMRPNRFPVASLLVAAAIAALTLSPLAGLIFIAFEGGEDGLWPHLLRHVLPQAFADTALLLTGVAIVAGLFGAGTAWLVTTFTFPGRRLLVWLLPLPLAIPAYIAAYIYTEILEFTGPVQSAVRFLLHWTTPRDYWFPPIRSLGGAIFVFSIVLYPYVYLTTRAMLLTQPASATDAARMLGAGRFAVLRDISLPLARPALTAGIALTLLETLNDIGASDYLGVRTLTLTAFNTWLNRGSLTGAAQIALMLLIVIGALLAFERWGRSRKEQAASATPPSERIALRGGEAFAASAFCWLPVTLGFVLPAGFLLRETVRRGLPLDPELAQHLTTTLMLAAFTTGTVLVLATAGTLLARLRPHHLLNSAVQGTIISYALPGTVLAIGLLPPLAFVDSIIALMTSHTKLILIGSGAGLIIACSARFLTIGTGLIGAGLSRIPQELDHAARLAGATPARVARNIHMPLLRPALFGAALLVFVDTLKELPASLLLRPLNTETLATYLYQFASRGSFEEGAAAALLIVAAGLPAVAFLAKRAETVAAV